MSHVVPRVLVLVPNGAGWESLLVAAGRSGAMGLLDLIGLAGSDRRRVLDRVRPWADRPFAARVEASGVRPDEWTDRLSVVVCSGDRETDWPGVFEAIRRSGRIALAEVVDRSAARAASEAGADGMIVSGLEGGGRCGEESSFVLLQGVLADGPGPCWVRGGIGRESAAACVGAGASGVVLDGAVLLAREAPLDESERSRIARLDGGETLMIGPEGGRGPRVRVEARPGSPALARLRTAADEGGEAWRRAIAEDIGWAPGQARPIGQDGAFASSLASRGVTVGGIVQEVARAIEDGLRLAAASRPLAPGSPMAASLGTRYPIVQGPMTRVSDSTAFAEAVARGGALPMLALAMLRGPEARSLLIETAGRLDGKPWGVGVLGFIDPALRAEQIEAIREARPPLALIAGGRPDQAEELEGLGIRTFLHAPSPGLLAQYLRDGARRFVLEGRECGGHVGPRSSLVLWEQAIAEVNQALDRGQIREADSLHLLFAGGIHDARSAAGVAALAGPLASRGVKVGILIGTAYLFTREAVDSGAIAPRFQAEAIRCRSTVLLRTGTGHEVRAVPSPYTEQFERERKRLIEAGTQADEIQRRLERLNVGRLRVASKGVDRGEGPGTPLVPLSEAEQYERGLYMIGQVATLRDRVTTIGELHDDLCVNSLDMLEQPTIEPESAEPARPSDVAIVGMAAIMPGARDLQTFWQNTLGGVDAIVEIPPDRWDWRPYYDPDGKAPDRIISRWGGFVPDVPFDPLRYGMPPTSLPSIEPAQLLVLEAVRAALDDAGYAERAFPKERTAVVLGMGGGAAQLAMGYAFRSYLPMLESVAPESGRAVREQAERFLPEWTEDAFPGFLLNVTAGRVANRFDLGGANYTVDAACGSSLAAANLAVRELETGAADMVILGGADTVQNPFTYLAFSKTHAFSPRGRCRPFDASADGIVISEGVGVVVLKRLADAERDGDRIYAVIKGLGSSSDGRARGLTAPNGDGQERALARAYDKAGVRPSSVGYFEAHGTGTAVGDVVEVNALAGFLRRDEAAPASAAVGSVKSMIGHTKCAAGLAGLINASLALHHRVLPPTIGVDRLNPAADLRDGPLRVSAAARPWLHADHQQPRRAGVSAFGFGGTNFHAVLEAYEGDPSPRPDPVRDWPAELFVWKARDRDTLRQALDRLARALDEGASPRPRDLAHTLLRQLPPDGQQGPTLAIVASTIGQLREFLEKARDAIARGESSLHDPRGMFFEERPAFAGEKVAVVFPGQGAQRLEMLLDLSMAFEEVRGGFESFDAALVAAGRPPVGPRVFPPTTLDEAARERARRALTATEVAQPAVGAASVGAFRLLETLGLRPDVVAGHSYGELVALHVSGALEVGALAGLSEARGRLMSESAGNEPGVMAAFLCDADRASGLIDGIDGVVVANRNGPRQTVLAGDADALNRAIDRARAEGIRTFELSVGAAFHSPRMAGARTPMAEMAAGLLGRKPALPVFSNLDAAPHPDDPTSIARRLGDHLASPVQFSAMIEAMYGAGARVFVECGPGAILAPLVGSILGDRPHLAVSCDQPGRPGIPTLLSGLARLLVAGVPLDGLDRLTRRRDARILDLERLSESEPPPSGSTWLVNGSRARPLGAPEPGRLGMAPEYLNLPSSISEPHSDEPVEQAPDMNMAEEDLSHRLRSRNGYHQGAEMDLRTDRPLAEHPAQTNGHATLSPHPIPHGRPGAQGNNPHLEEPSPVRDRRLPSPDSNGRDRIMESFQETMQLFLHVQRDAMRAYLDGGSPPPPSQPASETPASPTRWEMPAAFEPREQSTSTRPARADQSAQAHAGRVNAHRFDAQMPPQPPDPAPEAPARSSAPDAGSHGRNGHVAHPLATGVEPDAGRDDPPSQGSVADRLIEIVRDRTGYPPEMLGMTLDLEADLGIDSIKRVEILGNLRDSIEGLRSLAGTSVMDGLARAKTLGEIVAQVESALAEHAKDGQARPGIEQEPLPPENQPSPQSSPAPEDDGERRPSTADSDPGKAGGGLRRMILEAVEAPAPEATAGLIPGGILLVTDDGRGAARSLAGRFRQEGLRVELVGPDWADLASPSAVEARCRELRAEAPIAGIIHAQPIGLSPGEASIPAVGSEPLSSSFRGLFVLARAVADDLERSARQGGSCLIAATTMGGALGTPGISAVDPSPGQGGVAGLIKTLAREWPAVRSRVVDFDPSEPPGLLADRLAFEASCDDGWPEVGYVAGRRIRLRPTERGVDPRQRHLEIQAGEPVLITGGARGITAAVAIEMARRWKPTLLLVGSSPLPAEPESEETSHIQAPGELKSLLLRQARSRGMALGASELEQQYRSLLRAREIRHTLGRLREEGVTVEYAQADVRDAGAMGAALDRWRRRHGEPVGFIHGAGVIHDKLVRDKTLESFDRVVGTKVDGALNLVRLLRGDALRFSAFFSSVAGRFGNQGQSDYAAANEVLNKLALWLDRRWPGRVVSINWGPWAGLGMVSDLQEHLGRRGLGMIDPAIGCRALMDELQAGRKGEVEVILASELGGLDAPLAIPAPSRAGALP